MVDERIEILTRLEAAPRDEGLDRAKTWLRSSDIRQVSPEPVYATVSEISHVWRVRAKISRNKGHLIDGAEQLLAKLQTIDPRTKLEQLSFAGKHQSGTFFFEKTSGKYVGIVLVPGPETLAELSRAS